MRFLCKIVYYWCRQVLSTFWCMKIPLSVWWLIMNIWRIEKKKLIQHEKKIVIILLKIEIFFSFMSNLILNYFIAEMKVKHFFYLSVLKFFWGMCHKIIILGKQHISTDESVGWIVHKLEVKKEYKQEFWNLKS